MTDIVERLLWIERPHTTLPMTARGYASSIQDDLRLCAIDIDMPTKQGYTVQDVITVIVEAAMQTAAREAADEIERLREEVEMLRAHRDSLMAIIARQALEIELNNCIPEFSDVIGLPHH